jgi:hypothetical protein
MNLGKIKYYMILCIMSETFTKYYKLKKKYENQIKKQKKKIIEEGLPLEEKNKEFKKLKFKCLNCDRLVNMIFTNTEETLEVICGDTENPCNLNLKIEKSKAIQKEDYLNTLYGELQDMKETIIRIKLNLLYKFDNEENVLSQFEELKKTIKQTNTLIEKTKQTFSENVKKVENTMEYNEKKAEFYISLDEYKTLLNSFLTEPVNPEAYLRDALEVYINNLVVLQEEMRKLMYHYYGVDVTLIKKGKKQKDGPNPSYSIVSFYKQKYGLENTEISVKEEKVILNKK